MRVHTDKDKGKDKAKDERVKSHSDSLVHETHREQSIDDERRRERPASSIYQVARMSRVTAIIHFVSL